MREEIRLADQYARQDAAEADAQAKPSVRPMATTARTSTSWTTTCEDFRRTRSIPSPKVSKCRHAATAIQAAVWPGRRAVRERPGPCGLHHRQGQEVKGEDRIIASLEEQGFDVAAAAMANGSSLQSARKSRS